MNDTVFATDTFGNISVWDLRRGTNLINYKSGAINSRCLSILQNDYVLAAEKGPLVYAWPINSQEKLQSVRMVCPGVISCCTACPDGLFIAASVEDKLLIWQLSTGNLLSTARGHYQSITVVRWSPDGSIIVTGGEDGLVCVWKFSHLVSANYMYLGIKSTDSANSVKPMFTFSHHSIRITDLFVGGGGLRSRLFTASADKTCKIYDLATGSQLLSIIFDVRPTCLVVNIPEVDVFIGTFDGTIKTFSLLDPPRSLDHHFKESSSDLTFLGHTKSITCLALSTDETVLVSGSADETIKLWHIGSKQCTRTIRMKGSVTNVIVTTLSESLHSYEFRPTTLIRSFQKRYDDNQVGQALEINCSVDHYVEEETSNDGGEDVAALTQKIEQLQRINRELFTFAKNKIIGSIKTDTEKTVTKKDTEVNVRVKKSRSKRLMKKKK